MNARLVPLALALARCTPETAPAELAERCGVEGPVHVLELPPDERVHPRGLSRFGDRILVLSGPGDDAVDLILGIPTPTRTTARSVGLCGESPAVIGEDIDGLFPWALPDVLLGCRGGYNGDLLVLDPTGAVEPTLLVPGGCNGTWTDEGLVDVEAIDDTTARVLLYPRPDDPRAGPLAPTILLEPIAVGDSPRIRGPELFARDTDGTILRVTLADGDITLEQSYVIAYGLSKDGRYLVWQDALNTEEDGTAYPPGRVLLRDRETGEDSVIAFASLQGHSPWFTDHYVRVLLDEGPGERLVDLATRVAIDLPADRHFLFELTDGHLALGTEFRAGPWYVLDPATGEERLVADDPSPVSWSTDSLYLRSGADTADPRKPAELWQYFYDGAPARLLAHRVSTFASLLRVDGSVATLVDLADDWRGRLVAVDPDTLEERLIADHVAATLLHRSEVPGSTAIDLGYAVVDGERSGVWLARLPALE